MTSYGPAGLVRTRWWWVRHAPVRNDGGRIYGQSDLSCDCGDRHVFDALVRVLPRDALWFTSHLARTRETMRALWAAGDLAPDSFGGAAFREMPEFAEQHLGHWQGLDRASVLAARTGNPASYWFGPAIERPEGGESFVDLVARTRAGIAKLEDRCSGRDVVIVAHGGTIRAALTVALDLPPDLALTFGVDNCSLTRLDHLKTETGEAGWRVVMVNHQPWLGAGEAPASQPSGPEGAPPAG